MWDIAIVFMLGTFGLNAVFGGSALQPGSYHHHCPDLACVERIEREAAQDWRVAKVCVFAPPDHRLVRCLLFE